MSALIALLVLASPAEPKVTMRLNLLQGQKFTYVLVIDSERLKTHTEVTHKATISDADRDSLTMDVQIAGITINGKDRSKDLKKVLSNDTATLGWDRLSRRNGAMTGLNFAQPETDLTPALSECGIYLCQFPQDAVAPGSTWRGATTATGGCTSGTYKFLSKTTENGREVAKFEVSKIGMSQSTLLAPMKMTVDLASGLPIYVDYSVKRNQTGKKVHFRQVLTLN